MQCNDLLAFTLDHVLFFREVFDARWSPAGLFSQDNPSLRPILTYIQTQNLSCALMRQKSLTLYVNGSSHAVPMHTSNFVA